MQNKKGTDPFETAPGNDSSNSTAPVVERERGLFLPLAWAQLEGKPSRESRKLKRTWKRKAGGAISAELLGLLVLGAVVAILLMGVAK